MAGFQNVLPPEWRDWNITEELGEGSFGTVYKVEKVSGSVRAFSAVKVIRVPPNDSQLQELAREFPSTQAVAVYLKDLVQNYENEISTMYSLQGDSNIVSIQDHLVRQEPDGIQWKIYIRMELLTSFSEYMLTRNLTQQDVIRLGISMCNALIKCERLHIIHRDIKPDNIFVSSSGDFKLGDFGISRHLDRSFGNYSTKGTMNYMAPEVYKGEQYGSNVDLYSLGIILYKLTNRNYEPFLDTSNRMIYYKDKQQAFEQRMSGAPMPRPVDASPALSAVIMKACAFDPRERYQSAGQMRADLIRVMGTAGNVGPAGAGPVNARPVNTGSGSGRPVNSGSGSRRPVNTGSRSGSGSLQPAGSKQDPPKKKTGLIIALAVLLVIAAGGLIMFGLSRGKKSSSDDTAQVKNQTEQKQTEQKQTEQKQTEQKQTEQKQTEQKQTEQKQTEQKQTEQETQPPQPDSASANAGTALFGNAEGLPVTEKIQVAQDQTFLDQMRLLGDELAASKRGKNVLFAGSLENASEDELTAARDCIAWFKGNEDAGRKNYSRYRVEERIITVTAKEENRCLVNYVLFDSEAMQADGSGRPSDYTDEATFCLIQEENSGEWKIDVSAEGTAWQQKVTEDDRMLPTGLAQMLQGGADRTSFRELYEGNMLYLNKSAAYTNIKEYTPKYLWIDEKGNLAVSFVFSNGTGQQITWTRIAGTLEDTDGNLILNADVSMAGNPVSVPAGGAKLITITFGRANPDKAAVDLQKVTEETVHFE